MLKLSCWLINFFHGSSAETIFMPIFLDWHRQDFSERVIYGQVPIMLALIQHTWTVHSFEEGSANQIHPVTYSVSLFQKGYKDVNKPTQTNIH